MARGKRYKNQDPKHYRVKLMCQLRFARPFHLLAQKPFSIKSELTLNYYVAGFEIFQKMTVNLYSKI